MGTTLSALMAASERGDTSASEPLFAALYSELHRVARRELARSGAPSLGATSLLHQAYLDISARDGMAFPDRHRFMAYVARVMRGLIIDSLRHRHAQKRGGRFELTSLSTDVVDAAQAGNDLAPVSEALDALAAIDPPLAQVVDLKFFCGFSFGEIAAMQGISERTVQRNWQKARVYLHRTMRDAHAAV